MQENSPGRVAEAIRCGQRRRHPRGLCHARRSLKVYTRRRAHTCTVATGSNLAAAYTLTSVSASAILSVTALSEQQWSGASSAERSMANDFAVAYSRWRARSSATPARAHAGSSGTASVVTTRP
eukprot:352186-Chlamydomonas_euryale.AAC.2